MSSSTHLALIGGIERRGRWSAGPRILHVSAVGGADFDFTEAELTASETTLTAVSLVGGVHVTVPPDMRVEVSGFGLFGSTDPGPAAEVASHVLRVRRFGLVGGVKVERRAA
jgi:hypothetical protein